MSDYPSWLQRPLPPEVVERVPRAVMLTTAAEIAINEAERRRQAEARRTAALAREEAKRQAKAQAGAEHRAARIVAARKAAATRKKRDAAKRRAWRAALRGGRNP